MKCFWRRLTWSVELRQDANAPQPGILDDVRHVRRAIHVAAAVRPELAAHEWRENVNIGY